MKPLRDPELRAAILFIFGLTGITVMIAAYVLGGPEPPQWAMLVLGGFAFGPAAVTAVLKAWRGMDDESDNLAHDEVTDDPDDHPSRDS